MRILMAHNFYQIPGGEDTVFRSEYELLKTYGEEVFPYERHNNEINQFHFIGKASHFLSADHSRQSYRHLRAALKKTRPHIAHFHNIYYMMTPSVYQACRDEGVPVVQSLHNYRMVCANGLLYRDGHVCEDCLTRNFWEGVKHKCFRNSTAATAVMALQMDRLWSRKVWTQDVDQYIAAAEFTRKKYADCGIPIDKISLKAHFIYPDEGMRKGHDGYALYLGRLSEEKGVSVLLKAWSGIRDVKLKIAGTGPLETPLRNFAAENNVGNVEFVGFQSQTECQKLMERAAVVIIPSVCYENFPRVVVEAFCRGVGIVASRLGSLAELVEDGKTGLLFKAGDPADLQRAVIQYFENPVRIKEFGSNARMTFEEKYTPQANYETLKGIYQNVINRKVAKN
ncbi:MAG: glycosyltransferase family 4 protein [Candidatus Omnitrophica bacterium]|nr:glycosyltransferase family 4 protein [Candidatus Omnitrophota bacterium]